MNFSRKTVILPGLAISRSPIIRNLLLPLFLIAQAASAQVLEINQFKAAAFVQSSTNAPIAPNSPNSYFFGAYSRTDGSVSDMILFPDTPSGVFGLAPQGTNHFTFNSAYYSNQTGFDADFPGGYYEYDYDYTDINSNSQPGYITFEASTTNLYPAVIPAFTPATWLALQSVDPSKNLALAWNAFTQVPGADTACTFLTISNAVTNFILMSAVSPGVTSTNIPANTLAYGTPYTISLHFSERQLPTDNSGGSETIISGWDYITTATLTTIPGKLGITSSGSNVILKWPLTLTNSALQTTSALVPGSNTWIAVTNVAVTNGNFSQVILPVTGQSAYFRLVPAN